MKNILLTFLGITIISSVLAQYPHGGGILKAVVNGTSVVLKDDTTARNCAAEYQMQIDVSVDNHNTGTITWLQYDVGWEAGCDCHFNYSISLDSLQQGHYYANVFFTEVHGGYPFPPGIPYDTVYEGTVQFDIINSTAQHFVKIDSSASQCFEVYTDEQDLSFFKTGIGPCYPNPFQSVTTIPINNISDGDYIDVFNQCGKTLQVDVTRSENSFICNLSNLEPGVYYYKLHSNNTISKVFRMVLIK